MEPRPLERERLERSDPRPLPGGGRGEAFEPGVIHETNPDVLPEGRVESTRDRSVGSLHKELRDELTTLFRQEIALAKTELSEKAARTGRNIAAIAAGTVCLTAGLLVILYGLSALLYWVLVELNMSNYHAGWIAPLIVGAVTALTGYGRVQKGISTIKRQSIVPEKTVQSLKEDKQWLANQTK